MPITRLYNDDGSFTDAGRRFYDRSLRTIAELYNDNYSSKEVLAIITSIAVTEATFAQLRARPFARPTIQNIVVGQQAPFFEEEDEVFDVEE